MSEGEVEAIARAVHKQRRPVVLIDGGSGSGKTALAVRLAPVLGAQLVRLDDFYPGWDGLDAGSELVRSDVLGASGWRRWDWATEQPAEWHELDRRCGLVIEGCGALSRANRALASYGVWVEMDEPTRKARALARDGEAYAPHWDRWAAQEKLFFQRERPDLLADLILLG